MKKREGKLREERGQGDRGWGDSRGEMTTSYKATQDEMVSGETTRAR